MKDAAGHVDERDDEKELQRIDDVVADLRGGYIEAKDKCDREAEDGRAAKDGVDADEEACGDAPCEFFGGGSHAEESEDREGDATVEPVVMDGRPALAGVVAIWFAGEHWLQDRLRS